MGKREENLLEYHYKLYLNGLSQSKDWLFKLYEAGYELKKDDIPIKAQSLPEKEEILNKKARRDFVVLAEKEKEHSSQTEVLIVDEQQEEEVSVVIGETNEIKKRKPFNTVFDTDWKPKSVIYHTEEFYEWIESINISFKLRKEYQPFNLYVQQAEDWIALNENINDYSTQEDQLDFVMRDFMRIRSNTLYAVNKYGWLKEDTEVSGRRKYRSTKEYIHQQIMLFLLDCGYSIILGKGRQIGGTSILGLASVFKLITHKNYGINYIAEDKDKAKNITADKIMFPFSQLPEWLKPESGNDNETTFRILQSAKGASGKKNKRAASAKISVLAPIRTAINSSTPSLVLIDEIGSISILSEMLAEARPTQFSRQVDGSLKQTRQVIMWGTGTTSAGGAAFEKEWKKILGLFTLREPQVGIVPIFLDWTTRCTEEFYNQEKKFYYGARAAAEGVDAETSKIQFHQHYPTTPEDMFVQTGKTLMGRDFIESNIKRIDERLRKHNIELEYGYFEPEYDLTKPTPDEDLPFRITGSKWVKCGEMDERTTSIIFMKPEKTWQWRYYAGTDPISSDTGTSKMCTAIWDELEHTFSCIVNFREANNPNYSFQQSILATLYYDTHRGIGCPEIVERNIGLAYKNYREGKGYYKNLLMNSEITTYFRSGQNFELGIDNRGNKTKGIINKLNELFTQYGDRFYHSVIYQQLRTFVCTVTRSGNEVWSSIDKRYYFDDVLFACVYAYLCAESMNKIPKETGSADRIINVVKYSNQLDANHNLIRVATTVQKRM